MNGIRKAKITKQMEVERFRGLASSVLQKAIKDASSRKFHKDIAAFVEGEWCRKLCKFARLSHDSYKAVVYAELFDRNERA